MGGCVAVVYGDSAHLGGVNTLRGVTVLLV
jgi:hypothetical protein